MGKRDVRLGWLLVELLSLIMLSFVGGVVFGARCAISEAQAQEDFRIIKEISKEDYRVFVQAASGTTEIAMEDLGEVEIIREASGFTLEPDVTLIKKNIYDNYNCYYYYSGSSSVLRILAYEEIFQRVGYDFGIDPDLLMGVGALESKGYVDSTSCVKAIGLMQIYSVSERYKALARQYLGVRDLRYKDPKYPEHNIVLGTITLIKYTESKNNNLFFGLASYVWGPNHKILDSPSYQEVKHRLPEEAVRYYPIKALALTLMIKVYRQEGRFIPYHLKCKEEDEQCKAKKKENQKIIESIELPGVDY